MKRTILPLASAARCVSSSKLLTTSTSASRPSAGVATLPPRPSIGIDVSAAARRSRGSRCRAPSAAPSPARCARSRDRPASSPRPPTRSRAPGCRCPTAGCRRCRSARPAGSTRSDSACASLISRSALARCASSQDGGAGCGGWPDARGERGEKNEADEDGDRREGRLETWNPDHSSAPVTSESLQTARRFSASRLRHLPSGAVRCLPRPSDQKLTEYTSLKFRPISGSTSFK